MSFTPPKKDIVQMLTPSKERQTTAITPYKGQQSTLDFLIGGTPQKTPQQLKTEKKISRIKELKHSPKVKDIFEYNDLKSEMTSQPNLNKDIASSIINDAIKNKKARKEVKEIKDAGSLLTKAIKNKIARTNFKEAKDNFNEAQYQEKIRQKRKEFTRIKTTDSYPKEAKDDAQKRFNKTEFVFKRKSNAGRPAKNPYDGLKQTEL
jgi:hypothetical protein